MINNVLLKLVAVLNVTLLVPVVLLSVVFLNPSCYPVSCCWDPPCIALCWNLNCCTLMR